MAGDGYNFTGVSGDWSSSQTVTIGQTSSTSIPTYTQSPMPTLTQNSTLTPSPTPTVPEFPTWIILPLFAVPILLSTIIGSHKS